MLQTKLVTYIASTLLANTLIVESLLPVSAKSVEPTESRNPVEKLALNPLSATYTDSRTEIYSTQSNQGQVIPSPFTFNNSGLITTTTITGIGQQFLIQDFESRLTEDDIEVLNAIELDLDSILDTEFEQKGAILISRCCF
ncbi:hypothetical protein JYQ62_17190 [Nostoc sp. UHCC 0702]|nr:hypothetical protein JYQ62_17190 [Nostoc sp. UHCC 0702]